MLHQWYLLDCVASFEQTTGYLKIPETLKWYYDIIRKYKHILGWWVHYAVGKRCVCIFKSHEWNLYEPTWMEADSHSSPPSGTESNCTNTDDTLMLHTLTTWIPGAYSITLVAPSPALENQSLFNLHHLWRAIMGRWFINKLHSQVYLIVNCTKRHTRIMRLKVGLYLV